MPRYLCDYCDAYLTHDSAAGRHQHATGWKHRENFKQYYMTFYPQWVAERQMQQMHMGIPSAYMPGMPPGMALPFPPGSMPPPPQLMGPPGQSLANQPPGMPIFRPPPGAPQFQPPPAFPGNTLISASNPMQPPPQFQPPPQYPSGV